jgi:hypothetical protein
MCDSDNLMKPNIDFKDAAIFADRSECLSSFQPHHLQKQPLLTIERLIPASPRLFMRPESAIVNLYYKLRLRKRKAGNSKANTFYTSERNTMYEGKSGNPQNSKHFLSRPDSRVQHQKNPTSEYFADARALGRDKVGAVTPTSKKKHRKSSK